MRRLTLRFILSVLVLLTLSRLGLALWMWAVSYTHLRAHET